MQAEGQGFSTRAQRRAHPGTNGLINDTSTPPTTASTRPAHYFARSATTAPGGWRARSPKVQEWLGHANTDLVAFPQATNHCVLGPGQMASTCFLKSAMSYILPFNSVLHFRTSAAAPIASLSSASVAPAALAALVWA